MYTIFYYKLYPCSEEMQCSGGGSTLHLERVELKYI